MSDARAVLEAVWRIESGRVVAALSRLVGDIGLAEELAQDTLVVALEQWPQRGVPDDPGPWLMATAKHRAIDLVRRRVTYDRKLGLLGTTTPELTEDHIDDVEYGGDDLLRLIFTTCHPALTPPSQVALTLRLLGGLSTDEIARAHLTTEATISQRILRAKRTLAAHGVGFELPAPAALPERLAAVLRTVYLIFNEGYSATAGDSWLRKELCDEALRLGRVLQGLLPAEPEVHGLTALMELQASRIPARLGPAGEPVLLPDQDRARWDRLLVRRGLAALGRAEALGTLGPYGLQAAIAAGHARAVSVEQTDWVRIVALYRLLAHVAPSAVVSLNLAVAVGMADGPQAGLALVDTLAGDASLGAYPHLPAVRGDLLARLGRHAEAAEAFAAAAALTRNAGERTIFANRAAGERAAIG